MELALSALASFGGTAAGTAAAGAGVAGGVGAAAGGGGLLGFLGASPVLTVLAGGATALSVMQQLHAGNLKAEEAEFKSIEAKNEAIGAQAEGARRAAAIKRNLLTVLGENDVAYAASGIDISYGEAAGSRARTRARADDELSVDRATTDARAAGFGARSLAYDRMARGYREGALLGALATGAQGLTRIARRG